MAASGRPASFKPATRQAWIAADERKTVRAAAQHYRIAALEAEGAGVGGHVGAALVDHPDDPERRRHALDDEAIGAGEGREHPPDGIGQRGDVLEPAGNCLDSNGIEHQPVDQRRAQVLGSGLRAIELIGGQNLARAFAQGSRRGVKRAVLLLRRRVGDLTRGGPRLRPDFAHCGADIGLWL